MWKGQVLASLKSQLERVVETRMELITQASVMVGLVEV